MKTIEEAIKIIEEKRLEHEAVMRNLAKDVEILRQKMAEMVEHKADKQAIFTQANALMVLKDRMMFHKAAVLVYKDLLEDLNK